ncbi:MAG: hypothetical protein F6K00_27015 [Leptolyngbya sp. SIOISBB]|nr:hypothetical protein [Leptolyngbya sp. SIOISBB]
MTTGTVTLTGQRRDAESWEWKDAQWERPAVLLGGLSLTWDKYGSLASIFVISHVATGLRLTRMGDRTVAIECLKELATMNRDDWSWRTATDPLPDAIRNEALEIVARYEEADYLAQYPNGEPDEDDRPF